MALWRELVEQRIARVHDSRQDKRMSMGEAVRRFVRPGMKLNAVSLHAFRWTSAGGMDDLGVLPTHVWSNGFGVSADGSVVVGRSSSMTSGAAFRWTSAGGMTDLGNVSSGYWAFLPDSGTTANSNTGIFSPAAKKPRAWKST